MAIRMKNPEQIKNRLDQSKKHQINLTNIIKDYEIKTTENKLKVINNSGGTNSKMFWNLIRQIKKSNSEDLYAIKNQNGETIFHEKDIKQYTELYYKELYSKRTSSTYHKSWTEFIEKEIEKLHENRKHEKDKMNDPINEKEVQQAKSPKNNKSTGPDKVKNEFIKYGGRELTKALSQTFNKIFENETIPISWNKSNTINIDKGIPDKELLENKRGISLTNNICKIFEKVINNRIKSALSFTEAQAGAREGRSSVDQLFILKSVIQQRKFQRKQTYIALIDIEKAFDYTWREGMFYNLWQRGVRGKIWRIMYNLCQDQVTTINTKYGPANEIELENGIRQGKVLSGPEFGALVDEVEVELRAEGLGIKYGHLIILSLLFMDDITITSSDTDQLKNMLTVLEYVCNKWYLKINYKKSGVLMFKSKNSKTDNSKIMVGSKTYAVKKKMKYLGEALTNNLKITQHLKEKRTNIQSILHVCIYTAKNKILSQIKTRTLIKLYQTTILPALLYGCETWYISREDIKELTDIQFTIIRTILKLPVSTPKPALLGEIGEFPIELNIKEKKLMYLHKAFTSKTRINDISHIQIEKYNNNRENIINHNITFLEKYNINEIKETISLMAKSKWKKIVKTKIEEKANEIYKNECEKLKKLKCLNQYKAKIKRERYMDIMQQKQARILFKLRT